MATDNSTSLIKLTPSSTLTFQLERGTQPRTILKVANSTNSKVLFKVKTTQPTWYYVRPNQQILGAGQVEDVAILMVETECNRYLDQIAQHTEEKLDKHRFLVQSRVIDDEDYNRIIALPNSQRSDEFAKLWDGPKDDRKSIKLKVEFNYSSDPTKSNTEANARRTQTNTTTSSASIQPSVSENIDNIRNRLSTATSNDRPGGEDTTNNTTISATNSEAIFTELQTLRKKYDAVVEYTVHLTAERDGIVSQLETAQRELTKEKNKKRSDITNNTTTNNKSDKLSDKKMTDKGFSLFVVLIVALLCFLFGKYMS